MVGGRGERLSDMQFIVLLWLPIVLSAVIVFGSSSIIWMMTPLHKGDYSQPPEQDELRAAVKKHGFKQGMYYIPWCSGGHANMDKDEEFKKRFADGPWFTLLVPAGQPNFGRMLVQWFASQVVVAAMIAYVAHAAIKVGPDAPAYFKIFQIVGGVALLAHAGMAGHDTMWKGLPWRHTFVKLFDGLVYASLTAGCFAGFWPRH